MTNKIGEKIKRLRKKADVTQEKFADYLGITFQAVSRWESGVCYPDLEMLPAIANYFNVTTDELLGVDIMNKKEKADEIRRQVHENFSKGLIDENIAILRTAINEFPNDYGLLRDLAYYLSLRGWKNDTEAMKESRAICDRIWKNCTDNNIRYGMLFFMAGVYQALGEQEKLRALAEELPESSYMTRSEFLEQYVDGKPEHMKKFDLMQSCSGLALALAFKIPKERYNDDNDKAGVQKRIELCKKAIAILEITFDGEYGFENQLMEWIHLRMASSYMLLQDFDNALECLEKAADYAIAFDTLPEPFAHTSMLFEGYNHSMAGQRPYLQSQL